MRERPDGPAGSQKLERDQLGVRRRQRERIPMPYKLAPLQAKSARIVPRHATAPVAKISTNISRRFFSGLGSRESEEAPLPGRQVESDDIAKILLYIRSRVDNIFPTTYMVFIVITVFTVSKQCGNRLEPKSHKRNQRGFAAGNGADVEWNCSTKPRPATGLKQTPR
jgi:hypothetical protein